MILYQNDLLSSCMHYPQYSVWVHCCKRPNNDFCISQSSVATVFKWGGQNYSHLRYVSSLLKSAYVSWSYSKNNTGTVFLRHCVHCFPLEPLHQVTDDHQFTMMIISCQLPHCQSHYYVPHMHDVDQTQMTAPYKYATEKKHYKYHCLSFTWWYIINTKTVTCPNLWDTILTIHICNIAHHKLNYKTTNI